MKTPMQELIEKRKEERSKLQALNERVMVLTLDYAIADAEQMLEKEKEVMESAWQDGMYECDGDGTFEDFYKTFNTKEK